MSRILGDEEKKVPLIQVSNLKINFRTEDGLVRAVDGVDFSIEPEKTLGVVGESGCGKSVTAYSIMGLIPSPPGQIASGQILYQRQGQTLDLTKLDPRGPAMRAIRGKEIAMIFQEPMTALNPVYTIGNQIMEAIGTHESLSKKEIRNKAIEMLTAVGIPNPEIRLNDYPHQLSGGMRQRAMIAMAISCNPSLLIADEPTTALDVTIQAQVLDLMNELKSKFKSALMFITHDLGVIANMADEVMVMYLGTIMEAAKVDDIFFDPKHPYTEGLLNSIPSISSSKKDRLVPIKGVVPDPSEAISGCVFKARCSKAMEICGQKTPPLQKVAPDHTVACWLHTSPAEA